MGSRSRLSRRSRPTRSSPPGTSSYTSASSAARSSRSTHRSRSVAARCDEQLHPEDRGERERAHGLHHHRVLELAASAVSAVGRAVMAGQVEAGPRRRLAHQPLVEEGRRHVGGRHRERVARRTGSRGRPPARPSSRRWWETPRGRSIQRARRSSTSTSWAGWCSTSGAESRPEAKRDLCAMSNGLVVTTAVGDPARGERAHHPQRVHVAAGDHRARGAHPELLQVRTSADGAARVEQGAQGVGGRHPQRPARGRPGPPGAGPATSGHPGVAQEARRRSRAGGTRAGRGACGRTPRTPPRDSPGCARGGSPSGRMMRIVTSGSPSIEQMGFSRTNRSDICRERMPRVEPAEAGQQLALHHQGVLAHVRATRRQRLEAEVVAPRVGRRQAHVEHAAAGAHDLDARHHGHGRRQLRPFERRQRALRHVGQQEVVVVEERDVPAPRDRQPGVAGARHAERPGRCAPRARAGRARAPPGAPSRRPPRPPRCRSASGPSALSTAFRSCLRAVAGGDDDRESQYE